MRALIQRVSRARVAVGGETVGAIERGLLVLLGVAPEDDDGDIDWLTAKLAGLRVFPAADDPDGRLARSLLDVGGECLVVSQFTLFASTRKGTRPGFSAAAPPDAAEAGYRRFCSRLELALGRAVERGRFGAAMAVELVNDGPVTLLIDSRRRE